MPIFFPQKKKNLPSAAFLLLTAFILFFSSKIDAQQADFSVKNLTKFDSISLRGLSVVSDSIVWASGNQGTVALSTDAGASWKWIKVPGYQNTDFRDIEAFSTRRAIIMGIASPAYMLLTNDGGNHWKKVYENDDSTAFLDGMAWFNDHTGFAYGDPQNGRFFILKTKDEGENWKPLPFNNRPIALKGEVSFAASGTAIFAGSKKRLYIATGGDTARLLVSKNGGKSWKALSCPIIQGKNSTGIFSVSFYNKKEGIIAGGDYANEEVRFHNCFLTKDGGNHWKQPLINPFGYRSCVIYIGSKELLATGTSGTDISVDGGCSWRNISSSGYHVAQKAKNGSAVYLAGAGGRISLLLIRR